MRTYIYIYICRKFSYVYLNETFCQIELLTYHILCVINAEYESNNLIHLSRERKANSWKAGVIEHGNLAYGYLFSFKTRKFFKCP